MCDGKRVNVQLLALDETRDPMREAVREAVKVEVAGRTVELVSGNYSLPQTVGGVQIDCSITKGYNSNGSPESWGLDKDARLRLWPAGSPLVQPGTFGYPAKQRWFAGLTQMANEPVYVDGGERPQTKKIYYHSGLDIGGSEGLVEVVAATDGLVVSSGLEVLPEHRKDTPVSPRYDVVYLLDARGWYYRYSHMKRSTPRSSRGGISRWGTGSACSAKKGAAAAGRTCTSRSKPAAVGPWGTEEGYAFLWEAYQRQYRPQVIAVARPHHLIWAGEQVRLDGSEVVEPPAASSVTSGSSTMARRHAAPADAELLPARRVQRNAEGHRRGPRRLRFRRRAGARPRASRALPPTIQPAYAPTRASARAMR